MDSRFLSISLGCLALGILIAQGASAQTCGTGTCTGDQFCYQGDGYLVDPGFQCILFQAPLMQAVLSNYGGFSPGDHVRVEGCAEPIGFSTCMVSGYQISNNTIESADPEPEVPALGFSGRAIAILLVAGTALWLGKRFR
jgi:hypothetical protein